MSISVRFLLCFFSFCQLPSAMASSFSILNFQFSILNSSPVLMTIGGHHFDVDDFEYVYHKNQTAEKQTLDECLELYIPFKLKIVAAKDAGLDASPAIMDSWTRYSAPSTGAPVAAETAGEILDGLLLYAMTDSVVWSKAARDSVGLRTFYRKNARSFRWAKRMDATVYYCSDAKSAEWIRQAVKNKNEGSGRLPNGLFSFFCDDNGVSPCVDTARHTFPKGAKTVADRVIWKKGCSKLLELNGKYVFLDVHFILRPARKSFEEARGQVMAEYQNELENKWLEQLKKQYPVIVDKTVWAELKKKYAE